MPLPSALQRLNTTNFRLRVASACIMAPLALAAIALGGVVYAALLVAVAELGLYEWLRLVAPDARGQLVGFAGSMLFLSFAMGVLISPVAGACLGAMFAIALFIMSSREKNKNPALVAWVLPYMGGSALALFALRQIPSDGMGLSFFLIATVWGVDIGAYIVGSIVGGPRLAPAISPSKTWAGLIGGMASAAGSGYGVALLFGAEKPEVALLFAPVLAVVAQAGDLFESAYKRRAGVKESGDLIPGHGGVLDRIDGLVFAGMFAIVFQVTAGAALHWW